MDKPQDCVSCVVFVNMLSITSHLASLFIHIPTCDCNIPPFNKLEVEPRVWRRTAEPGLSVERSALLADCIASVACLSWKINNFLWTCGLAFNILDEAFLTCLWKTKIVFNLIVQEVKWKFTLHERDLMKISPNTVRANTVTVNSVAFKLYWITKNLFEKRLLLRSGKTKFG